LPTVGRKSLAVLLTVVLFFSMLVGTAGAAVKPSGPPQSPLVDIYETKYQLAVNSLYALGVVSGKTPTRYLPNDQVTRAEMAALAVRAMGKESAVVKPSPFLDVQGHWAANVIAIASEFGIVKGDPDGNFRPNDPVTYPQVVAMLLRALKLEGQAGSYPAGYVLLARDLGLIDGITWDMQSPAPRGDVALMLYHAVFQVPTGDTGLTLSQGVFKRAAGMAISPDVTVLPKGQTKLTAEVVDWVGKPLNVTPKWEVLEGSASMDATGTLNILSDSPVKVRASYGDLRVDKTYSVIRAITVQADKTAVSPGAQVKLSASGKTASGQDVAVSPVWSVVSGEGTVDATGTLTVKGSSPVKVKGTVGSLSAEVTINIVGKVTISPAEAVVGPNQTVQFTGTITDPSGKVVTGGATWSVNGSGTVDQNGLFRAGDKSATVVLSSGEAQATAAVKVIKRIEITPGTVSLQKGTTQTYSAKAYTDTNEEVSVPVSWDVQPASLGFFNSQGQIYAATPGTGFVVASYGGVTARAQLSVGGDAAGLRVTSSVTSLPANGSSTATITATLVDMANVPASGNGTALFSVSSVNLGTLDKTSAPFVNGVATVTLTAGTVAGSYSVIVSVPGSSVPSQLVNIVTMAPTVDHVAIEIYPGAMASDNTSQTTVTAKLVDRTGAPVANNTGNVITVSLNNSNVNAGRLGITTLQIGIGQRSASTTFTATGVPGTAMISGSSTYPVTPGTVTTQVVGGAYRLKLRTGTVTAKADGVSEIPVYVEVQDINGNVRTGDNVTTVGLSAISGATSLTIPAQTVRWGVATFVLKTVRAGTYDLNTWAVTGSAVQSDVGQVTFTHGPAYKLSLAVEPATSIAADGRTTATLRARILDAKDNLVTTANNVVRFTRVSGNVTNLPAQMYATAVNGEAMIQVTASTSVGVDSFRAESDNLSQSSTVSIATRITGVPVRLSVQPLTTPTIPATGSTTVQVWVLDQLNQLVTNDNGRMVFLSATNGATVSGPATTVNGVATFTVSGTVAGGTQLTATADGLTPDLTGRTLTIAQGAPDRVILEASPESLSADGFSRSTISAKLVDRFGNPVTGSVQVQLTPSSSQFVTLTSATVYTGGQVQVIAKNQQTGSTTITGVAGGYPVTPLTINTYIPGAPTRVVIDTLPTVKAGNGFSNQVVVKARILDQNGNLLTNLNSGSDLTAVAVRLTGSGSTGSTSITMFNTMGLSAHNLNPNGTDLGSAAVVNGVATLTVTNTRAETLTVTPAVWYKGIPLEVGTGTLTTIPGPAARLTLSAGVANASSSYAQTIPVTASVSDIYGNAVDGGLDTITFTSNTSTHLTMPAQTTVETTNGTAVINVTTKPYAPPGNTVITATSRKYGFAGSVIISTDLPPERPSLTLTDANGNDTIVSSGETGARIWISVPVRTYTQNVIVYVNGVVVPLYSSMDGNTTVDAIPAGSSLLMGYIRRADLGGLGVKEVRALVQTPVGMSPLSDAAIVTVQ